jgi:hypothetical protein
MNDIMDNVVARMSAARRNAESLIKPIKTRESILKLEQQREREAMAAKTERLRELRLAKEAADRAAAGPAPMRKLRVRRHRPRSF